MAEKVIEKVYGEEFQGLDFSKLHDILLLDDDGVKFFLEGDVRGEVGTTESGLLDAINGPLKNTAFVVAYRFANEYMLYAKALDEMRKVVDVKDGSADVPVPDAEKDAQDEEATGKKPDAFDDMVLMKLLPRITGDTEMVMRLFVGDPKEDGEMKTLDDPDVKGLVNLLGKKSASFTKMKEIVKRGDSNGSGTLTFWP